MNEKNVLIITVGIVICIIALGLFTMTSIIESPTDFTFNININHSADNNTKAMYEFISLALEKELNLTDEIRCDVYED